MPIAERYQLYDQSASNQRQQQGADFASGHGFLKNNPGKDRNKCRSGVEQNNGNRQRYFPDCSKVAPVKKDNAKNPGSYKAEGVFEIDFKQVGLSNGHINGQHHGGAHYPQRNNLQRRKAGLGQLIDEQANDTP